MVSWESAFWAVVPLAMNSMTQPAGMVCFLPSRYGQFLRCSPVICLFDALIIIEQFIWLSIVRASPFAAAREVIDFRFQDFSEQENDGSFRSLQKNTAFRLGMFFLGVLPQTIKLYSITGLLPVKLAGAAYLTCFYRL